MEATVANETIADDIDLRFHLFSKSSPIANDVKLLKEIAVTLNVPDVDSIGVQQLKNRLYDFITKGNKHGNKFVNTEVFMELTSADDKRKIAFAVASAVNNKDLMYSTKDFQWHFVEAGKLGDPILYVAGKDANMATTILINQCISDAKFRASIYGYLGLEEKTQLDIFREMTRKELMSKCDDLEVSYRDNEKKEDLVEKVCEKLGVEYKPL